MRRCLRFLAAILLFFFRYENGQAQKLSFQQYSVEQGLGQSQVSAICQDLNDNIWISTLGGISKFDGQSFKSYTETDGLADNYTNCIFADSKNNIWTGTHNGLSRLNNKGFKTFRFLNGPGDNIIRDVLEDVNGNIWVLTFLHLYSIHDDSVIKHTIVRDNYDRIMSMHYDKTGRLWVALRYNGIYCLESGHWIKKLDLKNAGIEKEYIVQITEGFSDGQLLLLTSNNLYEIADSSVKPLTKLMPLPGNNFIYLFRDKTGMLWFVTGSGIFQFTDGKWQIYNASNGLTEIPTLCIFQDREQNLWFGTSGDGVFRFFPHPWFYYSQFNGIHAIAMAMVEGRDGKLYIGTDGYGIFSMADNVFTHYPIPSQSKVEQQISFISQGMGNELLVGTRNNNIWKFKGNHFEQVHFKNLNTCINNLYMDSTGGFWICGCNGLYYYKNDWLEKRGNGFIAKIYPLEKNNFLISYYKGMGIMDSSGKITMITDSLIEQSHIMNIIEQNGVYFIATSNKGLIIYDNRNKKTRHYTQRTGISSDFVYSLVRDKTGGIWMGTGRGLNKISYNATSDSFYISDYSRKGDISSGEFNQDAAVCDSGNKLWFGTASGLMQFSPVEKKPMDYMPPLVLSVDKQFKKENHLSFSFNCASFENRDKISYQYKLEGQDKDFTEPSSTQNVIYPGLPPGDYNFQVRAIDHESRLSSNLASFAFKIKPAFYQTIFFKLLMYGIFIGIVFGVIRYRSLQKDKRQREIENIKLAEQANLRQQAAEDFHDELGNTITRIQLLADVVKSKLRTGGTEVDSQLDRIKENVSLLYQGTRDVIWALNPQSDKIQEVICRLTNTGIELFQETDTCFTVNNKNVHHCDQVLPGHNGRNILLIFKEAMNNIVKHAKASCVILTLEKNDRSLEITLQDNGIGFNKEIVKKGYGTLNMAKRAQKIDGIFNVYSTLNIGTTYRLVISLPS